LKKIGIIGIGKLGLCFALNLEKVGYNVLGIDISDQYVNNLNSKLFKSAEPMVNEMLKDAVSFKAYKDISKIVSDDIQDIFIMVATPSSPEGNYDHTQIEKVTNDLIAFGKRDATIHIYLGCTTMPGYCNSLANKMEQYGYTVSYAPEFIAQGSIIHDQQYPDQILIGEANEVAGKRLAEINLKVARNKPIVCKMDRLSAEITKLAVNCFLTTKISFANAIGDMATKSGADVEKILNAVGSDTRIGNKYVKYGFGFGGPCFPRDNKALNYFAKSINYPLLISEATENVNQIHLNFQFEQYLIQYKPQDTIQFEYVTYKRDSVSIENSQQLALAVKLAMAGRKIIINERPEVVEKIKELHPGLFYFSQNS
jgi:UDPglucose 6-dehydrogenase